MENGQEYLDINDFTILKSDYDYPSVKYSFDNIIKSICNETCFIHLTDKPETVKLCKNCIKKIYEYLQNEATILFEYYNKLSQLKETNSVITNKKIYKVEYNNYIRKINFFKNCTLIPKECQICLHTQQYQYNNIFLQD